MISVSTPRFEHLDAALGIGTARPRLSWQITGDAPAGPDGYEVEIARRTGTTRHRLGSANSVLVPWPDAPLASRETATVRVRAVSADGPEQDWSAPATVEAGLITAQDWAGMGIRPGWDEDPSDERRPPLLRRSFTATAGIARARLYATAHGVYELEINGRRVGEDCLNPGWTPYHDRLRYHAYDVTEHLRSGENAIGAWLGDGWWRGRLGFDGGTANIYGTDIALLAQLEIEYDDGAREIVTTDGNWRCAPSPIISSSLYKGETYDAGAHPHGWSAPGFDDSGWQDVTLALFANGTLAAAEGPPVRCTEELRPVETTVTETGSLLLDFGQNHSGRLRLRAQTGVSPEVTIRHAEVLQDGALYVRTLRDADSIDRYLGSDGSIDWEPKFTIHGFRYAEISGFDGPAEDLDVVSRVYHSDLRRTGWLETSDPSLNRLHENVVWSLRSNFVDIPTDCPQRDERLGWTGDIQVFTPTASYLFDVAGFLASWLKDVASEQERYGTVPWYVPVIPGGRFWNPSRPGAAWGDAAALTPWDLWERFGDRKILADQFASARAWVDQVASLAGPDHVWDEGMQLGDWLDPNAPPDDPAAALTDRYLVATAFFARSAHRVALMADQLGDAPAARRYRELAASVRAAFLERWGTGPGRLTDQTQTAYALTIAFDLFTEEDDRRRAGDTLADLVRANEYRIGAGFAGVNLVTDALTRTGHVDVAFGLLMERGSPSWLSMVDKGATTIWERWDSLLDDGTVNPGEMTSFNHYALGSVADWMQRTIGGIQPVEPGYRKVRFAPTPGGGLSWASARFDSPYGTIESSWRVEDGQFVLTTEVPLGVSATVRLPDGSENDVAPGRHEHSCRLDSGIRVTG